MSVRQMLSYIFEHYREATKAKWGKGSSMYRIFEIEFKEFLQNLPFVQGNPQLLVKASTGKGVWAGVPWIALLDRRETDTIHKGLHVIFLFSEDMSGVCLGIGTGITEFKNIHKRNWKKALGASVEDLRHRFHYLATQGFMVAPGVVLAQSGDGQDYGLGVSVYKLYGRDNLPNDSEIEHDIAVLLTAYSDYVEKRETPSDLVIREETSVITQVVEAEPTLGDVVDHFAQALTASHISFGENHQDLVRSFVTSLVTKRFVILTGLSGSGKTQIAMRFGEWLGEGRSLLVPVRPDWTGAEALFGYEDALLKDDNGRRAWHVPEALGFMLKAAQDQSNPYLLILDEMNLAHVERYFADVLSGMESDQPCLPNLHEEKDGLWRSPADAAKRIAFPRNLFIVGTVNVDETTYMFSPKVLDRANTFEFRVTRRDLNVDATKPQRCRPAPVRLTNCFLKVAKDDHFQAKHPATERDRLVESLQEIHDILADGGFEFGHRVFYEVLRFAAVWKATGDETFAAVLDRQVMQKVLPRLHGTRRRLEPVLCALGQYCFGLKHDPKVRFDPEKVEEAEARLKLSFNKVKRMTKAVRINQFASFTE